MEFIGGNMDEILENKKMNFDSETYEGLTLLIFSAEWCGPCKIIMALVEDLKKETDNIYIVNVDENPLIVEKYSVKSVPTILFFKDKKLVETLVGYRNRNELMEKIQFLKQ